MPPTLSEIPLFANSNRDPEERSAGRLVAVRTQVRFRQAKNLGSQPAVFIQNELPFLQIVPLILLALAAKLL